MLNSPRRNISYPNPTRIDPPDIPAHIKNVIDNLDIDVFLLSGTFALRPVSTGGSPGTLGRVYWSTDLSQLDLDFGTGWLTLYPQTGTSMPIGGAIEWDYAAAGIPSWALLQYGQAVSRTTYAALAALAAAASYPHGAGDGSTTFNLADKRGRVVAGKDDMGGTTAGRITAAISGTAGTVLGAAVGSEGVSLTSGQMPSHNHAVTGAPGKGSLAGTISDPALKQGTTVLNASGPATVMDPQGTGVTITGAPDLGSLGTGNTGGGGTHLNTQPTIICNKIIRAI